MACTFSVFATPPHLPPPEGLPIIAVTIRTHLPFVIMVTR